jgi:hypothetical protein
VVCAWHHVWCVSGTMSGVCLAPCLVYAWHHVWCMPGTMSGVCLAPCLVYAPHSKRQYEKSRLLLLFNYFISSHLLCFTPCLSLFHYLSISLSSSLSLSLSLSLSVYLCAGRGEKQPVCPTRRSSSPHPTHRYVRLTTRTCGAISCMSLLRPPCPSLTVPLSSHFNAPSFAPSIPHSNTLTHTHMHTRRLSTASHTQLSRSTYNELTT